MDRWAWSTTVKVIVGIMVAGFVAGIALILVDQLELTGAFPQDTGDFVADIQAGNEYFTARAPLFIAQGALLAIGFAALGLLGGLLARLTAPGDSRRPILVGLLLLAGGLGMTAQLLWMAMHPVATAAQYCDCGFLQEELMSRVMIHNVLNAVQTWLTNSAIIGAALGLIVVARPGVNAGMPVGWAYLAYVITLAAVVNVILWWFQFDAYPWNLVMIAIIAVILVPAWAIWLAMRSEDLTLDGGPVDLLEGSSE